MTKMSKLSWYRASIMVALVLVAGLGFFTWHLHQKVSRWQSETAFLNPDISRQTFDPWSNNWDPGGHFAELQKQMDEMMNMMSSPRIPFSPGNLAFPDTAGSPKVEATETSENYKVTVQVPKGEEVKLSTKLDGNTLTISGKVKTTREDSGNDAFASSLAMSQFSQTMTLPGPIDEKGMVVDQGDDEIVVTIPKADHS